LLMVVLGGMGGVLGAQVLSRRDLTRGRLAVLAALGLFFLLTLPYFLTARLDERHEDAVVAVGYQSKVALSAQPLNYLLSARPIEYLTDRGYLGGRQNVMGLKAGGEYAIFPGYLVWVLLIGTVLLMRGRGPGRHWLVYGGVFVLLSFGLLARWGPEVAVSWLPDGVIFLPATLFDSVPLLDGYRVFARMGFLVLLCGGVFIGLRWEEALGRIGVSGRKSWIVTTILAVLVVGERVEWPAPYLDVKMPAVYESLAAVKDNLILYEFPSNSYVYLLPQTVHGHRLANVYTSRLSDAQRDRLRSNTFLWAMHQYDAPFPQQERPPFRPVTSENLIEDFQQTGIDGVVVHWDLVRPRDQKAVANLLTGVLGLEAGEGDKSVRLYRKSPQQADIGQEEGARSR
ncbi:hypothetical protein HQ520_12120, partial [bacterium]|nr:hypothetical protein [bacterium]